MKLPNLPTVFYNWQLNIIRNGHQLVSIYSYKDKDGNYASSYYSPIRDVNKYLMDDSEDSILFILKNLPIAPQHFRVKDTDSGIYYTVSEFLEITGRTLDET